MSPRARRSESITLPPGNHPGLIRYNDDKPFPAEKLAVFEADDSKSDCKTESDTYSSAAESDLDAVSDDSYDPNDSNDSSSNSVSGMVETHGR